MFENAARKHFKWKCDVGGWPNSKQKIGKRGMGCVLDERHVLTARHCWYDIAQNYSSPAVHRIDGVFRCDIIFESIPHDILVLRLAEKIDVSPEMKKSFRVIEEYPVISKTQIYFGSSVGFMTNLALQKSGLHSYFAASFVSMFSPGADDQTAFFALSGIVMQHGFSGTAVFRTDASIVGVIVESVRFRADFNDDNAPIYTLPVMSPVWPLTQQIKSALSK